MFSGEWEIKSTTKLPVKEANQYRDALVQLAFPWAAPASAGPTNPLQQYVHDTVESVATRCAAYFAPAANTASGPNDGAAVPTLPVNNDHISVGRAWAPILYTMVAADLPDALVALAGGKNSLLVERSVLKDALRGTQQVAAFQANGFCLSYMPDDQYHTPKPHQLTLFYYLRVRYLLEKLLVRHMPKLLAAAALVPSAHSSAAQTVAPQLAKAEKRLRRHLHHALYVNLVLTRPCVKQTPKELLHGSPITPVAAMMTNNQISTRYALEGRTVMGPAVGVLRVGALSAEAAQSLVAKSLDVTVVAPGHSFPFAVGTIGADLFSNTLNALKSPTNTFAAGCGDRSALYYFGEEMATQYKAYDATRLGYSLYVDDLDITNQGGLKGHAFQPLHVAFDGLWELFWPSYSSAASRTDGVKGDWLVPNDLQVPEVIAAEETVFDMDTQLTAVDEDAVGTIDLVTEPIPPCPETMDDCLMFALAESLKELALRQRSLAKDAASAPALKVPIISVVGLYLKRHSPRIPLELRSVALGGKPTAATATTAAPSDAAGNNNNNNSDNEGGAGGNSDDDDEGEKKLSKAEKMAKRKAEKEAKNAEKKGGKGGKGKDKPEKGGKKGGAAAAPAGDDSAASLDATGASQIGGGAESLSSYAIALDFKHSSWKKSTAFFKDIATKSNGAYFTVPNDNEIAVKTNKSALKHGGADVLDILREHKRNFGGFTGRFHVPLVEAEEERRAEEEFAMIGGTDGADGPSSRGNGQETLEDEAKATVSSITQYYGMTNSVTPLLNEIFIGRWRPTGDGSGGASSSGAKVASPKSGADDSDSDDDEKTATGESIAELLAAASAINTMSAPDPILLKPLIGSKGKPVYPKASLLRNLRYYVIKQGLFYADDLPTEDDEEKKIADTACTEAFPALGGGGDGSEDNSSASAVGAGLPVWQRALLRREAEREAAKKQEEAAKKAAEAEEEAKKQKAAAAAANSGEAPKKGPLMVHLDKLLVETLRVSMNDRVMDMATFFTNVTWRLLMPQTRIVAQSPHRVRTLWIKSNLPRVLIKIKKRPGNRTIVYVVGIDDFGLSLRALAHRWKKEMACSVACEMAPPALGQGAKMCLALTGKVDGAVVSSLVALGIPQSCIDSKSEK